MIVVRVELWSAIAHQKTELARMIIANTGEAVNPNRGDYTVATLRGRDEAALERNMWSYLKGRDAVATHRGVIRNHARLAEHVWHLVAKSLAALAYGAKS